MLVKELIQYLKELPLDSRVVISIDVREYRPSPEKRAISTLFLNDHVCNTEGATLLFKGILNDKACYNGG